MQGTEGGWDGGAVGTAEYSRLCPEFAQFNAELVREKFIAA